MKELRESEAPLVSRHQMILQETSRFGTTRIRAIGPYQKMDTKNENNRIYPRSVWEKNLKEDSPFMNRLRERMVLGELEHPESGNTHLARVAILHEKVWIEFLKEGNPYDVAPGNYVMGQYLTLDTPNGRIIKELHEVKAKVGVSSRGRGDTRANGDADVVEDSYALDTWDTVYAPSVKEAYPKNEHDLKEQEEIFSGDMEVKKPAPPEAAPVGAPPVEEIPQEIPKKNDKGINAIKDGEELVRAMEDAVSEGEVADITELLNKAADILDVLSNDPSEDAIKLRGQIVSQQRSLTGRLDDLTGSKKSKKKKKKEKEEKEESLEEGDLDNLSDELEKERDKAKGPVFRGEIENALNRFGHDTNTRNISELAGSLRRKGYNVREQEYGEEPSEERRESMEKGKETVVKEDSATALLAKFAEENATLKAKLEALEGAVPADKHEQMKQRAKSYLEKFGEERKKRELSDRKYQTLLALSRKMTERAKKGELRGSVDRLVERWPKLAEVREILESSEDKKDLAEKAKKLVKALTEDGKKEVKDPPSLTEDSVKRVREATRKEEGEEDLSESAGSFFTAVDLRRGVTHE